MAAKEFVLLLPGADQRALVTVAEQVRRKVADGLRVAGEVQAPAT